MNRQEALEAMKRGDKVTHQNFTPEEWCEIRDGEVYTEDGYMFTYYFNKREMFTDGWRIL